MIEEKHAGELTEERKYSETSAFLPAVADFILTFISTFFTAFVVFLAGVLLLAAITDCRLLCVKSDSMIPAFSTGTLLVVRPTEFSDLEEGNIITYAISEKTLVTHRIVSINRTAGIVTTKGDANNTDDAPTRYENIVGKVIWTVPGIGPFFETLTAEENRMYVCMGFAIAIIALLVRDIIIRHKVKKKRYGFDRSRENSENGTPSDSGV